MEKITRDAAFAAGKSTYFTGKACKRGHISPRYVSNMTCLKCHTLTRTPVSAAWNVVAPPSGLAFPADTDPITPELVSHVWGKILRQMPSLVDDSLRELGLPPRLSKRTAATPFATPRLTAAAGSSTYAQLRASGLTDGQMWTAGLLQAPALSADCPILDFDDFFNVKGGTWDELVKNQWIVG